MESLMIRVNPDTTTCAMEIICSGAASMVPKALFESLGGFDSRYAPGYMKTLTWHLRSAKPATEFCINR